MSCFTFLMTDSLLSDQTHTHTHTHTHTQNCSSQCSGVGPGPPPQTPMSARYRRACCTEALPLENDTSTLETSLKAFKLILALGGNS